MKSIRCVLTNGERVTVLVVDGDPNPEHDPENVAVYRVVRRDGTVILEDVAAWSFGL